MTASDDTLLRQASMTAHEYMTEAVRRIDEQFGEGFARLNPGLVVGFMQTAALDFGASLIAKSINRIGGEW